MAATRQAPKHVSRLEPVAPRGLSAPPAVSVVIPILNERATLRRLLEEVTRALDACGREWEAILVDDGSTDGTWGELLELKGDDSRFSLLRLRRNFGKAAALSAGFQTARGDVIVTMDSDLQDDPHEIVRLLAKLDEGFDVASGWKERRRDPWTRRVLSRGFNSLVGGVTGLRLHDVNCGLKAYRRSVVEGITLYGELHRFIPVMAHFEGYRIAELPVNHRPRVAGNSRYGLERYLRGLLDLVTVAYFGRYRYRPLHLFGSFGILSSGAGAAICVYLTVLKAMGTAIGHRPLLVLGALLIVVGVQMVMMGLLAEMFTRTHEEGSGRGPLHEVDEIA